MPSLFERVGRSLTRKKPEINTETRNSADTALSGFEQISPSDAKGYVPQEPRSPTKEKSSNALQTFLRSKSPSRKDAPPIVVKRAPLLSLHLPDLTDGGSSVKEKLGIVFEDPPDSSFSDETVAAKRLTTAETLVLVQKTSSALVHRGLETPGIFKAFWYAQSAEKQRRLLVAFLQTLTGDSAEAKDKDAEPKPNPAVETFEAYLASASPHDVAEVFKWALRHFKLEGSSFGNSTDEYGWYRTFAESEKSASYPPEAYSSILPPLLPSEHQQLLDALFGFASSLASYAEINGVSGSKFTRLIGWWLLSGRREPSNGLVEFIQDWDTAARILEHLFLAYIRDQNRLGKMPKRLAQLIKSYPYPNQATENDQHYLPRPKFTTQTRPVLLLRVAVAPNAKEKYSGRPIQLLKDAIVGSVDETSGSPEYQSLWADIKRSALTTSEPITIQPASPVEGEELPAPIVSIGGLLTEGSLSMLANSSGESTAPPSSRPPESIPTSPLYRPLSPGRSTNAPGSTNPTAPTSPLDWDEFSGAGFSPFSEAPSLTFSDFGPPSPRQTSFTVGANTRSTKAPRSTRRRSLDFKKPLSAAPTNGTHEHTKEFPAKDASAIIHQTAEGIQSLDEAFIDGWAEILLDRTVASGWPSFALYELRDPVSTSSSEGEGTLVRWLAIETYVIVPPEPEPSAPSSPVKGSRVKRSSSVKSTEKRARFGFFSSSTSLGTKEGKEEKKEKRKDHTRRASEISTESAGLKAKDAAKSQPDLVAPPDAIAEEPEPSTPIPTLSEPREAPDVLSKSGATEEAATEPQRPTIEKLAVPAAEGSRFIEGSSPGTLPDSTAEPLDEGDVNKEAAAATVVAAADALNQKVSENDESVPGPEQNGGAYAKNKEETLPSSDAVPPVSDDTLSQAPELKATEPADAAAAAVAEVPVAEQPTDKQADMEVQEAEKEAKIGETGTEAAASQAEADAEAEAQRVEHERAEQERIAQEAAEAEEQARIEAERLEKERIALESAAAAASEADAKRLEELARQKAEAEELERQRIAEEEKKEEEARLEAERLAAEAAEKERLAEIARQEAEAKRLAEEEEAERLRLEAEALEAQRIEQERLEQERLEAERAEQERLEAEKAEQERLEAERAEQERLEAERIEKEQLEAERKAEEERLEAERVEQERLEAERLEAERIEKERLEAERIEQERLEAERLEKERLEQERIEAERKAEEERLEAERLEQERLEAERKAEEERLEAERLEAERVEKERLEAERAELERLEQERIEAERKAEEERLEAERLEQERIEAERKAEEARLEAERLEAERLEKERLEAERAEQERLEAERLEKERLEAERLEQERLEQERIEAERKAEEERLEAERLEAERLEAERVEQERLEAERKAEEERLEAERIEQERLEAERAEQERLEAERLEQERIEAERKAEEERLEAERLEKERLEAERLEAERLEQERLEAERIEQERLEAERIEKERLEAEKAEQARLEAERLEQERLEAERAEQERLEAERVEQERLEAERIEQERLEAEKAEQERLEAERLEKERLEAERVEQERLEAERVEKERLEAEKAEQERLEAERLEAERVEKERLEAEQAEQQRLEAERIEHERQEAERAEQERLEAEKAATEAEASKQEQTPDAEADTAVKPKDLDGEGNGVDAHHSHEPDSIAKAEEPTPNGTDAHTKGEEPAKAHEEGH
ncbi:hypothetical protein FRC17_010607 [Serendipita sp. 399]|nr:hypothetical protein FRC17_010607 [Serendipita sp. 399]